MKWYLFSLGLFSFIIYRSTKSEINFQGRLKGVYVMNQQAVDAKIISRGVNHIMKQSSDKNSSGKATGSYTISNKNNFDNNGRLPGDDRIASSMNAGLSPKKDFVNGNWVAGNNLYGGFFLVKPFLQ